MKKNKKKKKEEEKMDKIFYSAQKLHFVSPKGQDYQQGKDPGKAYGLSSSSSFFWVECCAHHHDSGSHCTMKRNVMGTKATERL